MKNSVDTHLGSIIIDNNVIANFAGSVALECYGVVGLAAVNMKEGLVGLLKKDSLAKGIIVSCENNKVSINLHIIVAFGCGVIAVANNLMSEVKYKVEQFAGLDVENVNVFIEMGGSETVKGLSIPAHAIFEDAGKAYVWVVEKGDVVKRHEVKLSGVDSKGMAVVSSGIAATDRVVKAGVKALHDGDPVRVITQQKSNVGDLL